MSLWLPLTAAAALLTVPAGLSFPPDLFPVAAVQENTGRLAAGSAPPRILTSDQWADYLIFRLYPLQKVFFDGRSDFFGPAIGADYRKLIFAESGWRDVLRRYRFDAALLPRDSVLGSELEREPGWRAIYRDRLAILLIRSEEPPGAASSRPQSGSGET